MSSLHESVTVFQPNINGKSVV